MSELIYRNVIEKAVVYFMSKCKQMLVYIMSSNGLCCLDLECNYMEYLKEELINKGEIV